MGSAFCSNSDVFVGGLSWIWASIFPSPCWWWEVQGRCWAQVSWKVPDSSTALFTVLGDTHTHTLQNSEERSQRKMESRCKLPLHHIIGLSYFQVSHAGTRRALTWLVILYTSNISLDFWYVKSKSLIARDETSWTPIYLTLFASVFL